MSEAVMRRIPWGLTIAAGLALILLLSLGVWQVQRLQWKEDLIARAEALVRRSRTGPEVRVLQLADLRLDLGSRKVERAGRAIALQPREFRLLACLMLNAGQVMTRTMLLEAVWDYQFDPQTNVIDVQISRLRTKLDAAGGPSLIHTERGVGYRLAAPDAPPA